MFNLGSQDGTPPIFLYGVSTLSLLFRRSVNFPINFETLIERNRVHCIKFINLPLDRTSAQILNFHSVL